MGNLMKTDEMLRQQASQLLEAMGKTNEAVGKTKMLLEQGRYMLGVMDKAVDSVLPYEIAEIVKFHSRAAAIAAAAAGWIPGVGPEVAATISAGFIWTMYGRIGAKIGVPFGKNVLKTLASGAATNLAVGAAGVLGISTALTFLPGLGNIGASVIVGFTSYAICLAAGYLYLKILTKLFAKGVDLSTVSEQELKDMAASAAKESDILEVITEAKVDFRTKKKQVEFS